MPWTAKGSPRIDPTLRLGLSEPYGSWKTIWMFRRIGRILPRLSFVMSCPLKTTCPDVAGWSAVIDAGERRLAATALPHEPERLSGADRQAHPVDRVDRGAPLRRLRPFTGKCFTTSLTSSRNVC